jgi:seryl-tRNA synthetase
MSDQLQKLVQDVAVLKEQNATSGDIHSRLDSAIDKLTDIQSGVKSMLAVHEARIERAEETDVEMQSIMNNRQETIREDIQTLHGRITDESKELRSYFTEKLQQLEKTKWIMVGVACALGISFSPMANMLTNLI